MSKPGKFIVLDGPDGSGKTTQVQLVEYGLKAKGHNVVTYREPGSTPLGMKIRSLLLDHGDTEPVSEAAFFLFMAARIQGLHQLVLPALERGDIVISDRFFLSTWAYQGADGIEDSVITHAINMIDKMVTIDLMLVLDVPVETTLKRIGTYRDRIESKPTSYLESVRSRYLNKAFEYHLPVIDTRASVDAVYIEIMAHVHHMLTETGYVK